MYAVVDLETTGGSVSDSRIMEIAIYVFDGEKIVDEFHSLVNPNSEIPPFISQITGITYDMIRDAPQFYEVAKQVVEITEGCIFVAHNARFDYSFIKKEFKELGYNYDRKQLCTLKLSRRLIPGMDGYGLGKLTRQLGIPLRNRHRAFGDARATVEVLRILLDRDENLIREEVRKELKTAAHPPNLRKDVLDELPNKVGIYYFHGEDGEVLYVGKSNNIRTRILSHFRSDLKSGRFFQMKQRTYDISFELTGNELVALLLEAKEIKRLQPFFNKAQKNKQNKYGIYHWEDGMGYLRFDVRKVQEGTDPLYRYATKSAANGALAGFVKDMVLCREMCGIGTGTVPCFEYQVRICEGACMGEELPEQYNVRAQQVIAQFALPHKDFLVIGKGRSKQERTIVLVEQGEYTGFGFFGADESVAWESPELIKDFVSVGGGIPEGTRLVRQYLLKKRNDKVIPL